MKNLKKKKVIFITIAIIAICVTYFGIEKIMDNYVLGDSEEVIIQESENIVKDIESKDIKIDKESTEDVSTKLDEENIDEDETIEYKTTEEEKIYVYVTGEVNNGGVVILNKGSRIVDAINAAGGTTEKANVSKINLVYVLEDGMKVNIPNDDDLKNNPDFEYVTLGSGDGIYNISTSQKDILNSTSNTSGNNYNVSIVNINTATQTELETLPGIGPSLALKIINYRNENGKFSSIEDIKNVSGIGESKFNNIKDYIIV